jgi:N-methylhydantoinase A
VTALARQLELRRVIVPRLAAVLSAWGMLTSDLRYEIARSHVGDASSLDADGLRSLYAELADEGRRRLAAAGFEGAVHVESSADMRYGEQIFEVAVDLNALDWDAPDLLHRLADAFHDRHEQLFTYALRDQEAVLVNARVAVTGVLPSPPAEPAPTGRAPAAAISTRKIWLGAWQDVPVFDFDALAPGQEIPGAAIVESPTTTVLLRPGDHARVNRVGWLDVAL